MSGWIKMHRGMMNHWCSADPNFLAVWLRLLFDANYEDNKSLINGTVVNIKRGQVLFGLPSFSKRSGVTVSKLRRILSVLSEEGMIDRQTTNKYSIISITKYEQYQADDRQKTNKTHSKNKQNATSKEDNNLRKKEKKENYIKEFAEFWDEYPSRGKHSNPKKDANVKFIVAAGKIEPAEIINAAKNYCKTVNGSDPRFTMQAATWLNKECWSQYATLPEETQELDIWDKINERVN